MNKSNQTQPSREVFIVRLWREDLPQADWNGQVQHVDSGKVTAIRDLDNLLEFFQNQLGESIEEHQQPSKLK